MLNAGTDGEHVLINGIGDRDPYEIIYELSLIAKATLLTLAERDSESKSDACLTYGVYARDLSDYVEESLEDIDEFFE